jgi:hypothetical protein
MSKLWQVWAWPVVKVLLAVAILGAVGWQFYTDLRRPELYELTWRPGWLALSAVLYLLFLSTSCWYWRRLLQHFGAGPPPVVAARAYFVSQLGKYVPGKAWALLLRGALVRGPNLRLGLAILTSFYEVLTTMAAGALVAAVVFVVQPPVALGLRVHPVLAGFILLGLCGLPLLPAIFNRIVRRLAKKLQTDDSEPLPKIDIGTLLQGLAATGCGWCLLGVSVWAGLAAVLPEPPPLDASTWLHCLGAIGLAYVGGFLVVFLPSGLGAREGILRLLLGFAGPEGLITAAILLTRAAWTVAELLIAGILYVFGTRAVDNDSGNP